MGEHGIQQGQGVAGVIAKKLRRNLHGLAGFDQGGEVHHAIEAMRRHHPVQLVTIGDVAHNQLGPPLPLPAYSANVARYWPTIAGMVICSAAAKFCSAISRKRSGEVSSWCIVSASSSALSERKKSMAMPSAFAIS